MNFLYKPSPHIRSKQTTFGIVNHVFLALAIVAVWGIINQYMMFGTDVGVRAFFIMAICCITSVATHFIYYFITDFFDVNKKFESFAHRFIDNVHRVFHGAPMVTALILALCLPAATPLYVVVISAVFAEIFAKLLFGGFGNNIFNPAAVGFVFAGIAFGSDLKAPLTPDAITAATPLGMLSPVGWILNAVEVQDYVYGLGGFRQMLLGNIPGSIGETARLATLLALVYMIYKRVLDWAVPVVYVGTCFIMAMAVGIYMGVGLWYPMLHVMSGGLFFSAVFMATDPVTNPVNRQGRVIFAILLGMLTMIIRFNSSHTEGVAYALLIMNMFVPIIDKKTANHTASNTKRKWVSVFSIFAVSVIVVLVFAVFV